jgi:hypothetical protein
MRLWDRNFRIPSHLHEMGSEPRIDVPLSTGVALPRFALSRLAWLLLPCRPGIGPERVECPTCCSSLNWIRSNE